VGSERSSVAGRSLCEQKFPLDIRTMARCGGLGPGGHEWVWRKGQDESGIEYEVSFDRRSVRVMYFHPRTNQVIENVFLVEWLPCRFGGSRPWFRCRWCNRRCAIIYGTSAEGRFACRKCLNLGYAVENETSGDRAWRAYHKVMNRLGGSFERPTRMRAKTYLTLVERAHALYTSALAGSRGQAR
jgi:hypothetical protein